MRGRKKMQKSRVLSHRKKGGKRTTHGARPPSLANRRWRCALHLAARQADTTPVATAGTGRTCDQECSDIGPETTAQLRLYGGRRRAPT